MRKYYLQRLLRDIYKEYRWFIDKLNLDVVTERQLEDMITGEGRQQNIK